MANIVIYDPSDVTVANKVIEFRRSVNTPDFAGEPNKVVNPDLSALWTEGTNAFIVPFQYWKYDGVSDIVEMSQGEKDAIDASQPIPLVVDAYQLTGIGNVLSEPMGFSPDATRSNKILSSESFTLIFSESRLSNMDWIQIGGATDADSGFIMPFDGTIVRATAHCENTRGNVFNFQFYKNAVSVGSILQLAGSGQQTAAAVDLDFDFDAGDKLRMRAVGSNYIEDTVIVVWVKWRHQ